MVSPARLCLTCKGSRKLCGWRFCPLMAKMRVEPKIRQSLGTEFFGPSTSVFVGHNFYPNVYVGPMAAIEREGVDLVDSPAKWFGKPYDKIIEMRSMLLRSEARESIFSRSDFVGKVQELALASKPTDVELLFKKKPKYSFEFSDINQPMGPTASLEKLSITENTRIPESVEKIVRDEIGAGQASGMLYDSGLDVHKIMTILSSGALGLDRRRKMVPTRWSITAIDDTLTKQMLERVRDYKQISSFQVYESEYLDNHFVMLFMPGSWEFENFEAWSPGSTWSFNLKKTEIIEEYEPFGGRTTYADQEGGGYYASRFSIVQALDQMKKQARVVVFREISEGYVVPLGVWVVRSTAAEAFKSRPKEFATKEEALNYVSSRIRLPLDDYKKMSIVLRQRRIGDF